MKQSVGAIASSIVNYPALYPRILLRKTGDESMVFLVAPAYNEKENLRVLIPEIDSVMRGAGLDYRLIVADDGSTDGSGEILSGLSGRFPLKILLHRGHQGVGAMFAAGFREALKPASADDVIVVLEADWTNDPSCIPIMCGMITGGKCDIVIASRYQKGSAGVGVPWLRRVLSACANLILRLRFPIGRVKDYTMFFRAYRAGMIRGAFDLYGSRFIDSRTFLCSTAMLVRLRPFHPRIEEIPHVYRCDRRCGRSKMTFFATIADFFIFLFTEKLAAAPGGSSA